MKNYKTICTTKVTILWLYIVQNVQVASMVTVLYRHQSHITITILWKILYYQGHHTVPIQAPVTHHDHHTMKNFVLPRSPYCDSIVNKMCKWLYIVQNVQVASMVTVLYSTIRSPGTSHTSRSPYYEKFCTTKVTILWLYIVQNTCTIQAPVTHHDHHTIKNFVLPRSPYCDST